jgi:hypothetical protein
MAAKVLAVRLHIFLALEPFWRLLFFLTSSSGHLTGTGGVCAVKRSHTHDRMDDPRSNTPRGIHPLGALVPARSLPHAALRTPHSATVLSESTYPEVPGWKHLAFQYAACGLIDEQGR